MLKEAKFHKNMIGIKLEISGTKIFLKRKKELSYQGFEVVDIEIDLD